MAKRNHQFQTIRSEGAILPPGILRRIGSLKVEGATPDARLHLRGHYLAQLPIISLQRLAAPREWFSNTTTELFLAPRVLELTYTAWDLEAFALDCGYAGPPFRWDQERRFVLRCELDAAYFHLYLGPPAEWGAGNPQLREMFPTPKGAACYIMETFPIVRRKDLARTEVKSDAGEVLQPGRFLTKDTILDIYDPNGRGHRIRQTVSNPARSAAGTANG